MGAGSGIPVMNRRAAQFLLEQGCRFVTASSELSGAELRTLMQNHPPVVVPAYGREQLMLLHHCPARTYLGLTKGHAACRMCDKHSPDALAGQTLTDRRGTVYPLLRQRLPEGCLVRLMNALPTNNIRRVRQAGYAPMMVLTTENAQEAADVRAVMDGEMREWKGRAITGIVLLSELFTRNTQMMKERTLRVLEFTKIRDRLASKAMTDMGRERCEALVPSSNMTEIQRMQAETEEATVILQYVGASPLVPFSDVRASLTLAEKGATLSTKALLEVAALMQSARAARKALDTERDNTPILKELAQRLSTLHNVEQDITNAIISEDEIADRASNELMDIRRHLRGANERIKEKLNQMIRSSAFQKYLQDPIVTMRNDRYCLPVKAEYRGSVPGLVHDQSSTGATLFIEPMAAVEMGNELKTWAAKEKQEIERILAALSAEIAPYADQLRETVETLAELDYIFAKGMLSREMNAVSPKLNQNGYINIIRGRHPLIDREKVVPSNLWMGKDFTSLIITGPNTGGKTVTLKTVGLLTLMAQAGLQVPADLGTELAVFEQVFADIGDEQSIEQSLSTFSGHMTTIVSIMHEVTPDDLVLFDELGAGTDPTEGAALAQAILQRLLNIRVRTLATTHYSELKAFALSTKGVENASVEFDVETLRPTYRLSIGVPGKSNAFEISRRLGLPENLIDDAKKLLSSDSVRFEDVIANAEYHRQVAEREREIARQASAETVKLRDEAEKLRKQMEDQRENTIKKAKADARRIMEQTRRESESIIADLKRMKKEQQNPDAQVNAIRRRIENNVDNLSEGLLQKVDTGLPPKEVRKGRHGGNPHHRQSGNGACSR